MAIKRRLYQGDGVQVLVEYNPDTDSMRVITRAEEWHTFGPPCKLVRNEDES